MFKILGGVVAGIFLGAMAVEIARRLQPGMLTNVEHLAKRTKENFVDSFRDGYTS